MLKSAIITIYILAFLKNIFQEQCENLASACFQRHGITVTEVVISEFSFFLSISLLFSAGLQLEIEGFYLKSNDTGSPPPPVH